MTKRPGTKYGGDPRTTVEWRGPSLFERILSLFSRSRSGRDIVGRPYTVTTRRKPKGE